MFASEHEPLAFLVELTPKSAKKRFRDDIYKAWDHKCGYCGDTATSLDHIVPRFKSGSSNRHNLFQLVGVVIATKHQHQCRLGLKNRNIFTQAKMDRIKNWMRQEAMDLFVHQVEHLSLAV
jgi:5-methylcytosine-specific restriction endonuclease McrA